MPTPKTQHAAINTDFVLSPQLHQALCQYLAARPWAEVNALMGALLQLERVAPAKEATAPAGDPPL
jgi:hypothetical protein